MVKTFLKKIRFPPQSGVLILAPDSAPGQKTPFYSMARKRKSYGGFFEISISFRGISTLSISG